MPRNPDQGVRVPPSHVPLSGQPPAATRVRALGVGHKLNDPDIADQLLLLLAEATTSAGELAKRFGVTRQGIYAFKARHKDTIARYREELGTDLATIHGRWLADREARIGELQDLYERLRPRVDDPGEDDDPAAVARTLISILHEAAEQLGQLPSRVTLQQATVLNVEIVGVDMSQV